MRFSRLLQAVAVAAALLALTASSALAARGHVFKEAFGTPCTTAICAEGELKEPSAVAVNEATNQVYVLDQGNNRIEIFDGATGEPAGEFDGSGTPALSFEFGIQPQVSGIAVDNSCSLEGLTGTACTEADPSNEDVYVVDARHKVVDKFTAAGVYINQIKEADGEPLVELGGVAVETSGGLDLYQAGGENGRVDFFDNALFNAQTGTVGQIPFRAGGFAPGLGVEGEGNLYLRASEFVGGVEKFFIEKYDHSGHLVKERVGTQDSSGIAADQKTNRSFVDNLTTLAAFSPSGSELERLGKEGGAEHLAEGAGVAADAAREDLYVADRGAGQVVVFEAQQPSPPEILGEGVIDISSEGATLEAELKPRSEVGEAPTAYFFEYGPCAGGVLTCAGSPFTSATPAASLPADFEIHRVTAHVTGLQPNTTYHFRLGAENAQSTGPILGTGKSFVTQTAGASLLLPDSRAWELVSPSEKQGSQIGPIEETGVVQAADDGEAITYLANAATEPQPQGTGVSGSVQVLSTRGPGGWASQDLPTPHQSATGIPVGFGKEYRGFSEDLAFGFVNPFGLFNPAISPEATEGTAFRRTDYLNGDPAQQCIATAMDCYRPIVTAAPSLANVPAGTPFGTNCVSPGSPCGPLFQSATPDGDFVVLRSQVALTGTATPTAGLYEWNGNAPPAQQLRLVSILPGGGEQPVENPYLGYAGLTLRNAISDNGTRVVFSEGGGGNNEQPQRLFLRDIVGRETIHLDAGEGCTECESGGAKFQAASTDGSRVFFTDTRPLTEDSGASQFLQRADLYECRVVESETGGLECELTDLTPMTGGERAAVQGAAVGASADGSSIYFVANGVLTNAPASNGELAQPGACGSASQGQNTTCNLYALQDGQVRLVAVLSAEDRLDWEEDLGTMVARVSPNGEWLAFMSERKLTGYDNRDRVTGGRDQEVFLYDAAGGGSLVCPSCDPTGARPSGVKFENGTTSPIVSLKLKFSGLVAANVPGWIGNEKAGNVTRHQPRYLSDSGRLFFNTVNGLVPQDSNGTQDVYEYEPPNVGSCTTSSSTYGEASEGCVSLISSGSSSQESAFLDASESGNDVFFLTSAALTNKDIDTARDVYDARVGGGEAEVTEPLACSGDACQQTSSPPAESNPGSLEFQGPGNAVQCRKGQVKKGGKCVKKSHEAKKHKKKGHKKSSSKKAKKSKGSGKHNGGGKK